MSTWTPSLEISLFQILDCPYSTNYTTVDSMGTIGSQTTVAPAGSGSAYTQIKAYLDTISETVKTELITLLTRWQTIGTTSVSMSAGGVGSIQGVSLSYEQEKRFIEDRVRIIVPFYQAAQVIERQSRSSGSMISISR